MIFAVELLVTPWLMHNFETGGLYMMLIYLFICLFVQLGPSNLVK